MNNERPQSFMDGKMIMAIVLTTGIWFLWQSHLAKKYPNANKPVVAEKSATEAAKTTTAAPTTKSDEMAPQAEAEKLIDVVGENWAFKISSKGMGIRDFELKKFTGPDNLPVKMGGEANGRLPYETSLTGQTGSLNFAIEKVSDTHYIGRAKVGPETEVVKVLQLDEKQYRIDSQVELSGKNDGIIGLSNYLTEGVFSVSGGGFFTPQFDRQDLFVNEVDKTERNYIDPKTDLTIKADQVRLVAMGTQYFTQVLVDRSDVRPSFAFNLLDNKIVEGENHYQQAYGVFNYPVLNRSANFVVKYIAYVGPKDLHLMKSIDEAMIGVVDFGMFAVLGRPILFALKTFYSWVGNWGIAIILLTLLIRFIVLPLNIMSFKSMRGMQAIQPQIQKIKEKYKNDPQRFQQETMALYKEHKINPMGGCLPILVQIPVFLAFYQVLGHSVELYHAPFGFWIHDLSHKDPYFVLPLLMGVAMFLQAKLTPSPGMDPTQQKIMMFMPLMFTFFMLSLPSGLALYMLISTIFGVTQQFYFKKHNNNIPVATVKPA